MITPEDLIREIIPGFHQHKTNQNTNLKEWKLPLSNIPKQRRESRFICTFYSMFPSLNALQCEGKTYLNTS